MLRSDIVYKFQCGGCNAIYYGKTKLHFKVELCGNLETLALTGKRHEGHRNSAIKHNSLFCNHSPDFEDFFILAVTITNLKLLNGESTNKRGHLPLNKNKQSLPLELYDN